MQRKVLVASVAAAPLLILAAAAQAETQITTARTTPIATSTAANGAPDSVTVTKDGSIKITTSGAVITKDSANAVSNAGTISTSNVNNSVGVLVTTGAAGDVTNTGSILIDETYEQKDADNDGDADGVFAEGTGRYGIRVIGAGPLTGSIVNGGLISVEGNDSAGVSLERAIVGSLTNSGTISVTGARTYGVRTNAVSGDVFIRGSVAVQGEGAVGVAIDGDVGGDLKIQGLISARGYREAELRQFTEDLAKLDADDMLQGGPAVRVSGNVAGGVLLDVAPVNKDDKDDDEDDDGVKDAEEGSASITVRGSAPAMLIGSADRAVTIGAVGTGDDAYGLINRGAISAAGLYKGVSATGVQIGGLGRAATLAGGLRNDGAVNVSAWENKATGLLLGAGASAPTVWNKGTVNTNVVADGDHDAVGVQIDAGANVATVRNSGQIATSLSGERGDAYAIRDQSGTVGLVENTGRLFASVVATDDADDKDDADTDPSNETVTGKAVAVDLSANTTGATIRQIGLTDGDDGADGVADVDTDGDGVDDGDEPSIVGAIRFGSGDDRLELLNGTMAGDLSFGAGADTLVLDGGAGLFGALSDADGRLTMNIAKGTLAISNMGTIQATSLNVGATSALIFTVDPTAGQHTRLAVGQATIASGAKIGVRLTSLLTAPTRYTVIDAQSLTAGSLDQSLFGNAPYMYVAQAGVDQAANDVYVDVRRRTAAEMGLTRTQAAAYDAIYAALGADKNLAGSFLSKNLRSDFLANYDQLLPDQGLGLFASLEYANQTISQAIAMRPDMVQRYGPDSLWVHEINSLIRREKGEDPGTDSQTFGFIAGYESMSQNGGALGATLAYVNIEEHDEAAQVGEQTTASVVQAGLYWRHAIGGLLLSARAGGGYAWFDGDRRFISPDDLVDIKNSAEWSGLTAAAYVGASYEKRFGRYFVRPEAGLDYVYLREDAREERGGGNGFDLLIDERTWNRLSGEAAVAFGAQFGRDFWWRPEVRVGYRQTIAGELGDTVARFRNGTPFTLVADDSKDGAATLNLALRAGTAMSYLAIEGGAEARKKTTRYNLRLSGRMMF